MKYIYTYVYTQCQYLCQKQLRRGGGRTIAQYMSYNSSQPCYVKYKFGSMSREDTAGNVCNTHLTAAAASSAQVWPLFLTFSRPSGSCGFCSLCSVSTSLAKGLTQSDCEQARKRARGRRAGGGGCQQGRSADGLAVLDKATVILKVLNFHCNVFLYSFGFYWTFKLIL